jgi:hypothetical protein
MNMEICVVMTTLQHDSTKAYLDYLADEPIMAVNLCGPMSGGTSLRKSFELNHDGTGQLRIGSVILQTFTDLGVVQGKAGPTTGRIWEIDTSNLVEDEDICDLIIELGDKINSVEILVKAKRHRMWYAVLKNNDKGREEERHLGKLLIKEMSIPRPSHRQGQYEKNYDPGNLVPRSVDRGNQSGPQKVVNKPSGSMRWEPVRESMERRENLRMSSSGSELGPRAGPTPQGKAPSTNPKPTPSIFDRYKEHKEREAEDEGRDLKEPLTKTTMVNKY